MSDTPRTDAHYAYRNPQKGDLEFAWQLERELAEAKLTAKSGPALPAYDRLLSERNAAVDEAGKLREALTQLVQKAQDWCDAVDADCSWDGWDDYFKDMKWNALPRYRSALLLTLPTATK